MHRDILVLWPIVNICVNMISMILTWWASIMKVDVSDGLKKKVWMLGVVCSWSLDVLEISL